MTPFDHSTSNLSPSDQPLSTIASAPLVNRTHRTIRARAHTLQAQRRRARSLLLPLLVSSSMLVLVCYAIWSLFDEYELIPNGLPDASNQLFVFMLWFLPVVAGVIGAIWFRRTRFSNREDLVR